MNVVNADVTYQRLPRVPAAPATAAIAARLYQAAGGASRTNPIASRAPHATASTRPTAS